MGEKAFQTRLCTAQCQYGSIKDQYINIPKDHGVYFQDTDHPLLNANDHVADKHILQFGRCTSKANPKNMAGDVLSSVIPVFGLAKLLKSVMKCEGCICSPKTLTAWQNTNKKDHLDGVDGITDESKVMCFYGGIITINEAKESADDAQSADEDGKVSGKRTSSSSGDGGEGTAPKSPTERMPAEVAAGIEKNNMGVQNYVNNMNTSIPEAAMDANGFLVNSSALSCFSCGTSNLAESGNASIASYNASVALQSEVPLADMILANDILMPQKATASQQMVAMNDIFQAMGYTTHRRNSLADMGQGAVLLSALENKEEGNVVFHSFTQDTSGKLLCLENETIDINLEESTLLEIQKEKQEK